MNEATELFIKLKNEIGKNISDNIGRDDVDVIIRKKESRLAQGLAEVSRKIVD